MDELVRVAFNRAFAGQWGTPQYTSADWASEMMAEESIRRELSFAVTHESGGVREVVAFILNAEYEQDWAALGHSEGYTEYVGVVPEWRSRGMATQLLRRSASAFAERGHQTACLHVDNANPTEAMGVYKQAGYEKSHASAFYSQSS
jgi:ribosomal protein S18 acetylase RimI-like enzyme